MVETFELTNYNFYSSRLDMELITNIVDTLKEILEEDKKQEQPLFLKVADDFIMNIARKVVQEKKKTFLIGITGESASGKTVFVDNTIEAVVRDKKEGIYTVIRQDDYYKDTSKELLEAGSYDALFKTGFSFDTPDVIDLQLMRKHLLGLKQGETVVSPKYDFVTCVSDPDGEVKTPAKVVLTEGLYVLNEEVRDIMDVKVYVFTPIDVIKERWYKRAVSRGKTGEAADLQFKNVNETAQQYIRPTYQIADCIINGMVDKDYIKVITEKIMARLAAPHSSASICITTGTLATPFVMGVFLFSAFIFIPQFNTKSSGLTLSVITDAAYTPSASPGTSAYSLYTQSPSVKPARWTTYGSIWSSTRMGAFVISATAYSTPSTEITAFSFILS